MSGRFTPIKLDGNYLDEITELLEQVRPELATTHRLEFRNVFGAVGGYVDGHIFISHGRFGVAIKLPKELLEKLFRDKDVNPLRYFPKGHVKKDYAVLSTEVLKDRRHFGRLVDKSIKFVLSP